jgi:hypothetical protein
MIFVNKKKIKTPFKKDVHVKTMNQEQDNKSVYFLDGERERERERGRKTSVLFNDVADF